MTCKHCQGAKVYRTLNQNKDPLLTDCEHCTNANHKPDKHRTAPAGEQEKDQG